VGQRKPGDWGGLIIVGNGMANRPSPALLEGSEGLPQPINFAGGTNNADNSGILRYVRIEFAGHTLDGTEALNSLTLAAVGSGTTIDNVQVLAGLNDSFKWFGGAVDAKHLVSYEAGDDHFDASEGYIGRVQYAIAYQSRLLTAARPGSGSVANDPSGIENDGCYGPNCPGAESSTPLNIPLFANFTLVGPGNAYTTASGETGMMIRRGSGGHYVNGIVTRYSRAAISLRDASTQTRLNSGDLQLSSLLLAENGPTFLEQVGTNFQFTVSETANAFTVAAGSGAALFTSVPGSPTSASQFDWRPATNSPARTGGMTSFSGKLATRAGTFVTPTSYRGAADPNGARWWEGWTSYAVN
jgi:hypothetical protein